MYDFEEEERKLAEQNAEKAKAASIRRGKNILTYFGIVNLIGVGIGYLPSLIISFSSIFIIGLGPIIYVGIQAFIDIAFAIALIKGVTVVRIIYAILSFVLALIDIFTLPVILVISPVLGVAFMVAMAYSFFRGWQLAFNKNVKAYCRTRQSKF